MLQGSEGTHDWAPAEALKKPVGHGVHVLDPWALKDPASDPKTRFEKKHDNSREGFLTSGTLQALGLVGTATRKQERASWTRKACGGAALCGQSGVGPRLTRSAVGDRWSACTRVVGACLYSRVSLIFFQEDTRATGIVKPSGHSLQTLDPLES